MSRLFPSRAVAAAVLLASLGYFVDIYDLVLFMVVRLKSLRALGVPEADLTGRGVFLFNMQMAGMLLGGLLWGVLGDRRGRLSVLFGSILLYSVANLANAFVHSVEAYAAWRLIAGIGLAGELGAGITLVSELMSKETRGYGTMIVAGVGVLGALAASLVGRFFDWRHAYILGGVLGLLLLFLRIGVSESGMFRCLKEDGRRGDLRLVLASPPKLLRYLSCILVGVPIWYLIGVLVAFAPELGKAMGMAGIPDPAMAVFWCYAGLAAGDFLSGFLSQRLESRKRVLLAFILFSAASAGMYLTRTAPSADLLYALCFAMGVGGGYWAVFVTVSAEHFGTNIRATVATTAPNFVRGAVVLLTLSFQALKAGLGTVGSAAVVGGVAFALALLGWANLDETYGRDLDYLET